MKDKLSGFKSKSKDLTGEAKAKAEKEIDEVTKQHGALEEKMKQVEGSTEKKFLDLKNSLKGEFEEGTAEVKEKEGAKSK